MEEKILQQAVPPLILWYRRNGRALPWRQDAEPYHIWLSEIMLQQTRIETVIPYYQRFLEAFPTVEALAGGSQERLMKLWQGLGYYSRARNLKKAAEQIVADYNGCFPQSAEELQKLPGIGSYTAGAIASIAFGQPAPAVDGNVLRVLTRLLACGEDIAQPKTKTRFLGWLRGVYPTGEDAAALTQGLMELGEVCCVPAGTPRCEGCPLQALCLAHRAGNAEKYPVKAEKKPRKKEERTVLVLSCNQKFALCRRPEKGLLAGLWELPNIAGWLTAEEVKAFLGAEGIVSCMPCGRATHIFSHVEWHMNGFRVVCQTEKAGFVWKTVQEIEQAYAVPSAFRFFLAQILKDG